MWVHVCMGVCMCMYAHMHAYIHTYTHTYTCTTRKEDVWLGLLKIDPIKKKGEKGT